MGKKAFVVYFKVLSQNFPGVSRKATENLSQDRRSPGREYNTGPPEYDAGVLNQSTTTFGAHSRKSVRYDIDF
jgi:hypothetical protein